MRPGGGEAGAGLTSPLTLRLVAGTFAICRLPAEAPLPALPPQPLLSITRTAAELSLVVAADAVPPGARVDAGWRALEVDGPLDLAATGVLAALATPLAEAEVALFAVSTFDTDYLLVPEAGLGRAVAALTAAGHRIEEKV